MNGTPILGSVRVGDRVEVITESTGAWVGGYEIASASALGCHVRQMPHGEVLPAVFGYHDVRPASPTPDLDRAGTPAVLIYEGDASTVVRLPAELDIATVEAIRDAVFAAVDDARGEIVVD